MSAQDRTAATTEYLSRVLALNPLTQTEEIFELRSEFFSPTSDKPAAAVAGTPAEPDLEAKRAQLSELIARIREDFWTTPLEPLLASLQAVRAAEFPELRNAVDRLQTVARERHLFAMLTEKRGFEPRLFREFRRLVVAPAAEAAEIRDKIYRTIRDPYKLKLYKRMIRVFRKYLPATSELESAWLQSILDLKANSRTAEPTRDLPEQAQVQVSPQDDSWGCGGCSSIIVIYFIIKAVIFLLSR